MNEEARSILLRKEEEGTHDDVDGEEEVRESPGEVSLTSDEVERRSVSGI